MPNVKNALRYNQRIIGMTITRCSGNSELTLGALSPFRIPSRITTNPPIIMMNKEIRGKRVSTESSGKVYVHKNIAPKTTNISIPTILFLVSIFSTILPSPLSKKRHAAAQIRYIFFTYLFLVITGQQKVLYKAMTGRIRF